MFLESFFSVDPDSWMVLCIKMLEIASVSSVACDCSFTGIKLKKTDHEEHSDNPALSDSGGHHV